MGKSAKHSAILIAAYITTSVLNYGFGVALSWFFKPEQFGVLGVAQSLLLLIALAVGSGFTWTAAHDLAAHGTNDVTRKRVRMAFAANALLGLALAGGVWLAYLENWLPLGPAYRVVVPLVGLTVFLLALRSVVNGAARGMYRFSQVAVNLVGEVLVKVIVGLALVKVGLGVSGVMLAFAAGAALSLLHSLWVVKPAHLWKGPGWFEPQVIAATAPLFAGMLGTALILNLDVLGLKLLAPSGQSDQLAGLYQAAVILARTPVFVAQALTLVLFTYAAGQAAKSQALGQAASYTRNALRAWLRLLLPGGLVLILAPGAALSIFFPAQYHAARLALQIAAGGGVLLALVTLLTGVFQAEGQRRLPALAAGLGVVTQILVLITLVPRLGATGAALSLLAASGVSLACLSPLLISTAKDALQDKPFSWSVASAWASRLGKELLPFAALVLPLIFISLPGRQWALIRLGASGLSYLAAQMLTNRSTLEKPLGRSRRPVVFVVSQVVQVLIGG